MATVTGMTAGKVLEIVGETFVSAEINAEGHLILMKYDGSSIDVGVVGEGSGGIPAHDHEGYTKHIVLGPTDPVPPETAVGTLIFRTEP